jgi:exopolyphosphatase/guanosine-5'-triphosphate,3'-diphosphate pyrophosphatase
VGKPLAAIDIGSNTIHLLVGRVEDGVVLPLSGERIAVKLASGVGKTGRIESARMRLALDTVRLFTRVAALHGASKPTIIATSAVRDAENGLDLVGAIRVLTENDVRLLTGDAEADLGFKGAMSAVKTRPRDPVLVVDLGGGSAQLAQGEAGYGPRRQVSLPLGTSRTTERYLPQDPPSARQLRTLRKAVLESLPPWELPEDVTAVAVGGSARALLYLQRGDFTAEQLDGFATDISRQQSGVFARECGINPARARVLPAAATTLAAILEHYSISSLTVARTGLREGVLLTLAEGGKI